MTDEALRYPIGRFSWQGPSAQRRADDIRTLAALPSDLAAATGKLSEEQLGTPYRPDGWNVRQVVHHLADSHSNALVRFKLALTEDEPTIRPYDQDAWANLADSHETPIAASLALLDGLHARWVVLLGSLSDTDFERTFIHPEFPGSQSLDWLLALYGWHSRHHLAHVTSLAQRRGW